MTLRDVLAELKTQQGFAAHQRDVWWGEYFSSRRVVVVPDSRNESNNTVTEYNPFTGPRLRNPSTPQAIDDSVHVARLDFIEAVKILRGALAQPNIGAARPMIKSAIEKLEQK
jgi:hypothetical protein